MDSWTRESIEKYVKELTGEEISYSTPAPEAFRKIIRALREAIEWKKQLAGKIDGPCASGEEILSLQRLMAERNSMSPLPWRIRPGHNRLDDCQGNFVLDLEERGDVLGGSEEDLKFFAQCVNAVPRLINALLAKGVT